MRSYHECGLPRELCYSDTRSKLASSSVVLALGFRVRGRPFKGSWGLQALDMRFEVCRFGIHEAC